MRTFGCAVNLHESEIMAGLLLKAQFELTDNKEEADVVIINICTVKGNTTSLREIRKTKEEFPYKKLIISGCISKDIIPEIREITEDATLINTHNLKQIVSAVEETIHDNPIEMMAREDEVKLGFPKKRVNPVIAIIPICSSCNSNCAYCSVKKIKGRLISYPEDKIIEELRSALKDKVKEIWITAQDTASYMLERSEKSQLPELLQKLTRMPGDFKIRVGMMNPNNAMPIVDEMVEVFKHEKIFKFLHLPVQSGNDEILKKMNRHYTVEDFKKVVERFRRSIPEITLSTDIICGFPTETKEQFLDSVNLVKEIKPAVLNISRFVARPGTVAAKMEQVSGGETKDRSRYITSIFDWIAFESNKQWRNWQGEVLIDEIGKDNTLIARNYAYKPVIVQGNYKLGENVNVKIMNVTKFDLRGEVVDRMQNL
jgi:MiaB-like tRNA modifying enzyme